MRSFFVIGFLVLMCCDTLAQCGIKLASLHAGAMSLQFQWVLDMLRQRWLWWAFAGYLGSFFTWMTLLKHAPVGPAFAASHLEMISVLLVSVLWLGESLSISQGVGCVLILAGIALLGIKESGEAHADA